MSQDDDNKWVQPEQPPPPLFLGKKERDLIKQVNDEVIERVVGQTIAYYPISLEHTNYHDLYGEAIEKTFLPPVRVYAIVEFTEFSTDYLASGGIDKTREINVHFNKRRLEDDQNIYVREGDFVKYGSVYYEIVKLNEPKHLFGQADNQFEIQAECIRARDGLFNAK